MAIITFDQVADHLVSRLQLEPEWMTRSDEELVWFPWFLKQSIFVIDKGTYDDGDNWIRVGSEIAICRAEEADGIVAAAEWNSKFHVGAFMYDQGWIFLRTSLVFNPLNMSLLTFWHQQVLIHASLAHQFAFGHQADSRFEIYTFEHPVSGVRSEPEGLMGLYWDPDSGQQLKLELPSTYPSDLQSGLMQLERQFGEFGFEKAFESQDVTHFRSAEFVISVSRVSDPQEDIVLGPGLLVEASFIDFTFPFTRSAVNDVHQALWEHFDLPVSMFGNFSFPEKQEEKPWFTGLRFYLDAATLAEWGAGGRNMAIPILNASLASRSALNCLRWMLESDVAEARV